jgi:hypothetical protein
MTNASHENSQTLFFSASPHRHSLKCKAYPASVEAFAAENSKGFCARLAGENVRKLNLKVK